jgi:hypothetical protein
LLKNRIQLKQKELKKVFFLFALIYGVLCSNAQQKVIEYSGSEIDFGTLKAGALYKGKDAQLVGDNLNLVNIYTAASKEHNLWTLTYQFELRDSILKAKDIWFYLRSNVNAAKIYFNGQLLLENGRVGTSKSTEKNGLNLIQKHIPRRKLVTGTNQLKIRFSNYKNKEGAIFRDLSIGPLTGFTNHSRIMYTASLLFSGIFLFAILINIALYFSLNRKKTFLLLSFLFLINFVLSIYETLYWNGLLESLSFIHSNAFKGYLEYTSYFILLFIVYFEFGFVRSKFILAITFFGLVIIARNWVSLPMAISLSLIPFVFSCFPSKNEVSNINLIRFSLFLIVLFTFLDDYDLIEGFDFVHHNYIITSIVFKIDVLGMVFFAVIMIYTSAKGIFLKTQKLNAAKLQLEQLEYQFLQKHIQPHFLMNSLMSLQQLVTTDTENASKMIEALSEEFHLLTTMTKKKLVPIADEINMCKTHLQIMSIQQRASYQLTVNGITGDETIPPAVIHTLVENGITHGYSGNDNANFELTKTITATGIEYRLFNDSKKQSTSKKATTGSGLKYIEARLEECYPNKWSLSSNAIENGWEAIIQIQSKA